VVILKQCCILLNNLPGGYVFNQKDEFINDLEVISVDFYLRKTADVSFPPL
jgi:hypothetical protein